MRTLALTQGSDEWAAVRDKFRTASEASMMMDAHKSTSRAELLRMKATGTKKEFSEWVKKNLLENGHLVEAAARPLAEAFIGESLFPLTGINDDDRLLASFDGLTVGEDTGWECKSWNESKAAAVRDGRVPDEDYWQVVHQLCVGAERVLYTVTDGTAERTLHVWKTLEDNDRKRLMAGWAQFEEDLANYRHVEQTVAAVAEPVEALPALSIRVNGEITLTHNIERFGKRIDEYVASLPSKPETDLDFAKLDKAVKVLKEAEEALDAEETRALSQTESIAEMRNLVAMYRETARTNRLMFEKLVKFEKENRRSELVVNAKQEFDAHLQKLNARIGGNWMPPLNGQRWADAIKGLKSLDSMRDKLSTALAHAKLEANEIADTIEANRKSLTNDVDDWMFLFPDFAQVCTKSLEDFSNLFVARIAAERKREADKKAAEEASKANEEARKAVEAARQETAALEAAAAGGVLPANDQRGKTEEATHAQPQATAAPQAPAASTPPIQGTSDDATITEFLALLAISAVEKKALRTTLEKFVKYQHARMNMRVEA